MLMAGAEYRDGGPTVGMLGANPAIRTEHHLEVARLMQDLTASDQAGWMSVISLHGGGSPEAMRREIYRYYPLEDRRALALRLLDRGLLDTGQTPSKQPGRCCPVGCQVPETPVLGEVGRGRLAAE